METSCVIIIIAKNLSEVVFWQEQGEELKETNEGCIMTMQNTNKMLQV